ncbi:MAG: hypothetical protein WCA04_05540 [Geobacteraceae bacterium]
MRKSNGYFIFLLILTLSFVALFPHERYRQAAESQSLDTMSGMVRSLGLTDLCLFTEASYTRNVSQTDLRTPFQEFPMSMEHFPTGSLILPPR